MKKIYRTLLCLVFIILIGLYYYTYDQSKKNYINNIASDIPVTSNNDTGEVVTDDDAKQLEDSGIEGTSFIPDKGYYPYYEMLSNKEKKLYEQIYENSINMKTTFIPHTVCNKDEVNNAVISVFNDHPELFWLNTSYSYKYITSGTIVQITLSFNETASDIESSKVLFNEKVDSIINEANKLDTDYDKEKYVHDTIINNTTYDKNAKVNQSAYSAIVYGRSVCAGYARSFQYIMNRLGISTYYVTGTSNGEHAWNLVKIDNNYYNVDVTWDSSSRNKYTYFNISDNDISKSHTRSGLSTYLPSSNETYHKEDIIENKQNSTNEDNKINIPKETEDKELVINEKETDA